MNGTELTSKQETLLNFKQKIAEMIDKESSFLSYLNKQATINNKINEIIKESRDRLYQLQKRYEEYAKYAEKLK